TQVTGQHAYTGDGMRNTPAASKYFSLHVSPRHRLQPRRLKKIPHEMTCRSTGTRNPMASRLVSFARPATASSSMCIASVMPFLRAAAVCEYVQYSQPLVALTAT